MKRFFYGALAAGMLLTSGCGKKKEEPKDDFATLQSEMSDEELEAAEREALRQLAEIVAKETGPIAANDEMMDADLFDALDGEDMELDMASLTDEERQQLIEWEQAAMEWARQQEELTAAAEAEADAFEAINFEKGTADFDAASDTMSHNIAAAKEAVGAGKTLVVQGHTDAEGSAELSLALSEKRAEAVKDALVAAGLPEASIQTAGYSNALAKEWSTDEDGLAVNRRAELVAVS